MIYDIILAAFATITVLIILGAGLINWLFTVYDIDINEEN